MNSRQIARVQFSNMAGEEEQRNRSMKEALFQSLSAILSPSQEVRASGEEQIKALEVTEGKSDNCHRSRHNFI